MGRKERWGGGKGWGGRRDEEEGRGWGVGEKDEEEGGLGRKEEEGGKKGKGERWAWRTDGKGRGVGGRMG